MERIVSAHSHAEVSKGWFSLCGRKVEGVGVNSIRGRNNANNQTTACGHELQGLI